MDVPSVTQAGARIAHILALAHATGAPPAAGSAARAPATPAAAPASGGFAAELVRAGTSPSRNLAAPTGAEPDGALAARLDRWMARRSPESPLLGHGAEFVRAGRANGVDPRLLVAIAAQESGLGTAGSGRNIHNAFGWGPAIPFASWSEGIHRVAEGLRRGYLDEGRDTIAEIQTRWAPVGAANDPGGLNGGWTAGVSRLYAELGGDPAAAVRI